VGYTSPQTIRLKDGRSCLLRVAEPADTAQLLLHMQRVAAETDFLITTPAEVTMTEAEERRWIEQQRDDSGALLLVAIVAGEVVGLLNFRSGTRQRVQHHGLFGMSVQRRWHRQGIGRALLETLLA
jgi:predicted N-acetyltransferase YhbS